MANPLFDRCNARVAARHTWVVLLAVGSLGLYVQTAAAVQDTDFALTGLERGNTKPKEEPKIAFGEPGVVSKVLVKEGDKVTKGQIVAEQDDREEQAKLKTAESNIIAATLQIDASEAQAELARVKLKRMEELYADLIRSGRSNNEVDQARVEVKVGEATVKYHTQMAEKAKMERDEAKDQIEQKKLRSPINGLVAKIDVQVGEGTDISRPAMQLVQNDVLKVDVPVSVTKAKQLKLGQALQVRYLDEEQWSTGKIVFMTPYADASSGTRMIRLEMVNQAGREAGVPVYVKLPENLAAK